MSNGEAFEDEDAKFFELVKAALGSTYVEHRGHVLRILRSSPHPEPWASQTTMLRMGMRRSLDAKLQTPRGAAAVVGDLLETLEIFEKQGTGMEEWFFGALEGLATHPEALVTFSKYALLSSTQPTSRARIEEPGGSDESEVGDQDDDRNQDRDRANARVFSGGAHVDESADEGVDYLSTGEFYDNV